MQLSFKNTYGNANDTISNEITGEKVENVEIASHNCVT